MVTISKPISATQAREYHRAEFANASDNYYTEGERVQGTWHGRLAAEWGLGGVVGEEQFALISEGQHPVTGEQIVSHQTPRSYTSPEGRIVRTMEHRAGWDATFSAPKTVSLSALVGGDERIIAAHQQSVGIALDEMERFVQARMGGSAPAGTTGKWVVARFEHDSARPVGGYAAPQLHTHAVIFNLTTAQDGVVHALQPHELFRTQKYATAVYRAELAIRLQRLGYEIERGEHGSPEIRGYSREYVEASSPRRQQIKEHLAEHGVSGAEAAQIAAHRTRGAKLDLSREEVLVQHQTMAAEYGNQPFQVVSHAQEGVLQKHETNLSAAGMESALHSSIARNTEREALVDERAILADALRHRMGSIVVSEAKATFAECVQRGQLLEMPQRERQAGRVFTTPEMKQCEAEVLQVMAKGLGAQDEIAPAALRQSILASYDYLNESQRAAALVILCNRDQMMGLEGKAGTGKTTTLKAICVATKEAGFEVEGLAPTSRAALNLAEADIPTKTIARHLTEQQQSSEVKRFYVVDESSLASTRLMNEFLKGIRANDRVLFVGDTRQHEAVDAGRPYAQLQEAGMQSAQLTEIVRQKDAGLKAVVEQLAVGNVGDALANMSEQGRIHEVIERQERMQAIVRAYTENPKSTLVISPDNESRTEIAKKIHEEMRCLGHVRGEEYKVRVLIPRQGMTNEDRLWAHNYDPGDVLRYARSSKAIGVSAREIVRVISTHDKENLITVERQTGKQITYSPQRVQGVAAYREDERSFAEGDRVQFTAAFHPQKIANRELGTIEQIGESGDLILNMDSGRRIALNLRQHPHLDYGYAVTSHSSQGETVDRVLIYVDSEHAHKGLINNRTAYVSVSRARHDAQIFTNDAASLAWELGKDVTHSVALRQDEMMQAVEAIQHHREEAIGIGF